MIIFSKTALTVFRAYDEETMAQSHILLMTGPELELRSSGMQSRVGPW